MTRPLDVLVPLIKADIAAGDAKMRPIAELLLEAKASLGDDEAVFWFWHDRQRFPWRKDEAKRWMRQAAKAGKRGGGAS